MTRLRFSKLFTSPLIAGIALASLAFIPVSAAQAAASTTKPLPNPCATFRSSAVHAIFGVKSNVRLISAGSTVGKGVNQVRFCTVTYNKHSLRIVVEHKTYGFGGPFKCYKKTSMGSYGRVCVSKVKLLQSTWGMFYKNGMYVYDAYTATLPSNGIRMYNFVLAQYKAFK